MAREITCIPARRELVDRAAVTDRLIRLAAYARVSTNNEDQLYSFENQVAYYREYAKRHPEYHLVGVYADEGISGTSTKHREQFLKMISDCEAGEIDMVITKSISRFARNTADCLQYARKLKDLGVSVVFEKEAINTMDGTGELLFTILSSLAQDESRNISENTTWGIRATFRQGKVIVNTNRFLGYDKDEKGHLVINKEQAVLVRRIFTEFLDGVSPETIARRLCREGIPGVHGEPKWRTSTIMGILQNEKYMGDSLLQKTYTVDFLTGRFEKNNGQVEQYHVKGDHEAIIGKDLWDATQLEIKRRRDYMDAHGLRTMGRFTDEQPFSNRVLCEECGHVYWRLTWSRLNGPVKAWRCANLYEDKGTGKCNSFVMKETALHVAFAAAWHALLKRRGELVEKWKKQIEGGNPLERLRAQQMLDITQPLPTERKLDCALVNKVLDHVIVNRFGILTFIFLDGTKIKEVASNSSDWTLPN